MSAHEATRVDRLLASVLASGFPTATGGRRPLPLQEPVIRLRPRICRCLREVDRGLLAMFSELADGRARWPLFLYGAAGRGKTCAALALCDAVPLAIHRTTEEAIDAVVQDERAWLWDKLPDYHLAVLDELGARERVTDLHYQAVKRFADLRDQLPAVYISNLHPDQIADLYDDRIASRVLCGSWYELGGDDRRMRTDRPAAGPQP